MVPDWLRWIASTSVPMFRIVGEEESAAGVASGGIFKVLDRKFLCTVVHAVGNGKWLAQIGEDDRGTKVFELNEVYGVTCPDAPEAEGALDFAFCPLALDVEAECKVRFEGEKEKIVRIHEFCGATTPESSRLYGFCGMVKPESHPNRRYWRQPVIYPGLTYIREHGYYDVFALPKKHPGHDWMKGCSGAPIVGEDHLPVSLLCGGNVELNEVYGINLGEVLSAVEKWCRRNA